MKLTTLILTALLGLSATSLSAQSYSDYINKRICWNDAKLTWDDFLAKVPAEASDTILSFASFTSETYKETIKKNGTTYEYFWNKSYMQPYESWVRLGVVTDNNLKMSRIKFDLWELFSRKRLIEYNTSYDPMSWDDMSDFYREQFHRRVDELNAISEKGTNTANIDRYAAIVAEELAAATFDPEALVDTVKFTHGMFGSVGLHGSIPRSDYVTPSFGVDFSFGFYAKSMLYGFSLDLGGGYCKKYIETHNGEINEDDGLFAGSMSLMVGKIAWQKAGYRMTPYLGLGVKFFDGGTNFEPRNDNDNTTEKAGFTMGMGALFEVPLSHKICIKTESFRGISTNDRSILIKPYLSCSKFHGDMGWMPSVNIAVSYCWSSLFSYKNY